MSNFIVKGLSEEEGAVSLAVQEQDRFVAQTRDIELDTELKKSLADRTFTFLVVSAAFIAMLLLAYFVDMMKNNREVPKEVIIAMVTSTFGSAVGLVAFMVRGLFKVRGSDKD